VTTKTPSVSVRYMHNVVDICISSR